MIPGKSRNVRRDANKQGDTAKTDGVVSEDDLKKLKDDVQEQTKEHEKKIEDILARKVAELMEV